MGRPGHHVEEKAEVMGTILEALAVIKGKDATGGAFDAVAQKIQRISRAASALNRDVQKQMNIAAGAERAATRMERASSMIGSGAKMAAGAAAAYGGSRAVSALAHETVKAASDRAHEQVRAAASGMSPQEVKEAGDLAAEVSHKYKSISETEIMHSARNIRSVVGSFEEATKIIDPLMRLRVVALGAHPEKAGELGEDFDKLVKGMEIKGVTQDMPKFLHYMEGMAKAINVFGDTLRPTDYYEMFKYGRASTNALSDDFMLKTAPTLAQELGGSSAGKALSSFHTQFVGGKMSNKAVEMLNDLGLIDPDKVIKTSTGNIKGVKPGGVIGGGYLTPGQEDPYQWVNKILIPAMQKKGLTTEQINEKLKGVAEPLLPKGASEQETIAAAASQTTTAQMMTIFATQQKRIDKDQHLVEHAEGLEAAERFQRDDPKVIRKSIESQTDNYLANTANPFQPAVNGGMNWLASGLSYMSDRAKKDPMRSAAELGFGAGLVSAISADATMATAGKFGLGSGTSWGLTRFMGVLAPILEIASRRGEMVETESSKRRGGLHADKFNALADIAASERAGDVYGHGDPAYDAQLKALNDGKLAKIEAELSDLGYAGPGTPGRGQMASQWTVDDIRKATGIGGSSEPVKAEVVGEATLKTEITVSPSPDFLARVSQTVQNGINAFRSSGGPSTGTAGSTGKSMPEAGPPQ
jgi:hypothetical protein